MLAGLEPGIASSSPMRVPAHEPYVGVVGPATASPAVLELAKEVGRLLATERATIVCGGRGGVMEAVCAGAAEHQGFTIGILPDADRAQANRYLTVALSTGLGELRNGLIVNCSDTVIAVGGSWGALSEVSLAIRLQKHVVGLETWQITGSDCSYDWFHTATSAREAVEIALDHARASVVP